MIMFIREINSQSGNSRRAVSAFEAVMTPLSWVWRSVEMEGAVLPAPKLQEYFGMNSCFCFFTHDRVEERVPGSSSLSSVDRFLVLCQRLSHRAQTPTGKLGRERG